VLSHATVLSGHGIIVENQAMKVALPQFFQASGLVRPRFQIQATHEEIENLSLKTSERNLLIIRCTVNVRIGWQPVPVRDHLVPAPAAEAKELKEIFSNDDVVRVGICRVRCHNRPFFDR
jgi:hypothetical protein